MENLDRKRVQKPKHNFDLGLHAFIFQLSDQGSNL